MDCGCAESLELLDSRGAQTDINKLCANLKSDKCDHALPTYRHYENGFVVKSGTKLVHVACIMGKLEVLKFLQEQGCDLMSQTIAFKMYPAALALSNGHEHIFSYLWPHIKKSFSYNQKDLKSIIRLATVAGLVETVQMLLSNYNRGADTDQFASQLIEAAFGIKSRATASSLAWIILDLNPVVTLKAFNVAIKVNDFELFQQVLKTKQSQGEEMYSSSGLLPSQDFPGYTRKLNFKDKELTAEISVIAAVLEGMSVIYYKYIQAV